MHLLIISSASSTPKAMRSVSGTGTLPLQRDLLGIFVQRSGQIYDGAERSWRHGKKSGIAEVQAFVFWMCEHQKDGSFFNS